MSFEYEQVKEGEESGGSHWTSYSDLFMMLSVVFLLLYIVTGLRNSTHTIQQKMETKRLNDLANDYKGQLQVYNSLKEGHLEKNASEEEVKTYNQLMDKLSLLQQEAKTEKEVLARKSQENAQKEVALNQYQQIVRNIINANLLAKKRIERRDRKIAESEEIINIKEDTIREKESTISQQDQEIRTKQQIIEDKNQTIQEQQDTIAAKKAEVQELEGEIAQKRKLIHENEIKIAQINSDLKTNIKQLEKEQQKRKMTKEKLRQEIEKLKQASKITVEQITLKNQQMQERLENVNQQVHLASTQLQNANEIIQNQNAEKEQILKELERKEEELVTTKSNLEQQINDLTANYQQEMEKAKENFEENLKKQQLTAAEKLEKTKEFEKMQKEQNQKLQLEISKMQAEDQAKSAKLQDLEQKQQELVSSNSELENKIQQMTDEHQKKLDDAKKTFDEDLKKHKLSAQARIEAIKDFENKQREKNQNLQKEIAGLREKNQGLSADLAAAQEKVNMTKTLAKNIVSNFKKRGIQADVDMQTGDVYLSFRDSFFDTGKSELKPKMVNILEEFMPIYTDSLFQDEKIAARIKNVEIIGFASPTYQNRVIHPKSLDPKDKEAIQYNLDLSFKRAKSIFNHTFDTQRFSFPHQKKLLPMVSVTGRSFFTDSNTDPREYEGMTRKEFCAKYDCAKEQKVVIKFNIRD